MNPLVSITESTAPKPGEQYDIRCAAACVQHGSQHCCFIRGLQNERRERCPAFAGLTLSNGNPDAFSLPEIFRPPNGWLGRTNG
jgi:hypothetical protein